jgi:hypothetical protein
MTIAEPTMRRLAATTGLLLTAIAVSGCSTDAVHAPQTGPARLAFAVDFDGPAAALGDAFDKADNVVVKVAASGLAPVEVTRSDIAGRSEIEITVEVNLPEGVDQTPAAVDILLRRGSNVLFDGSADAVIQRGATTPVEITLAPVAHGIALSPSSLTLEVGEEAQLTATVSFVTGDEIPGAPVSWSTVPSSCAVSVDSDGTVTAESAGSCDVRAASGSAFAVAPVEVTSPVGTITGSVTADGEGLSGVTVSLSGPTSTSTSTGSSGTFTFADVLAGTYDVSISGIPSGYDCPDPTRTVTLAGGATEEVFFTCSPPAVTGAVQGRVVDGLTGDPLPGTTVTALLSGSVAGSAVTDSDGRFSIEDLAAGVYDFDASRSGYVPAKLFGVQVVAGVTRQLQTFLLVVDSPSPGDIEGRVISAADASAIAGATVELREGIDATEGSPVATTTTGSSGFFFFGPIPAGTYTISASASGFVDGVRTGISVGGTLVSGQDVVLSPTGGSSDQYRVVLTWGGSPSDLDSHLTGPLSGGGRFHVYYGNPGTLSAEPFAELDIDDTSSFGPETITFIPVNPGVYRYSVYDFTNGLSTSSTALAGSGAEVRVFRGPDPVAQFFVPSGGGTLWTVFELVDGEINAVNSMSYTTDDDAIPVSGRDEDGRDAGVIAGAPGEKGRER